MNKLLTNKLILSVLCIVIGMAPLVAFINTVESSKQMLKREFGENSILVSLDLEGSTAVFEDFKKLPEEMPEINAIIPIFTGSTVLNSYKNSSAVTLKAVDSSYWKYAGLEMSTGKFITKGQFDNSFNVVVIDELTADELFGTTDVLGRKVETIISGIPFEATIIGVSKRFDNTVKQTGQKQGFAYIPITMLDKNQLEYNMQKVVVSINGNQIEEAKAKISHFLLDRDVMVKPDAINQIRQLEIINTFAAQNKIFLLALVVLWLAAAILGITNIMLVDIEHSKKYYGLLSFFGITSQNIRNKVQGKVYEIALACGIISIVIGITISFIVCNILNIPIYISVYSLTIGIILPIAICFIAAIYPSYKASNIDINSTIWQLD